MTELQETLTGELCHKGKPISGIMLKTFHKFTPNFFKKVEVHQKVSAEEFSFKVLGNEMSPLDFSFADQQEDNFLLLSVVDPINPGTNWLSFQKFLSSSNSVGVSAPDDGTNTVLFLISQTLALSCGRLPAVSQSQDFAAHDTWMYGLIRIRKQHLGELVLSPVEISPHSEVKIKQELLDETPETIDSADVKTAVDDACEKKPDKREENKSKTKSPPKKSNKRICDAEDQKELKETKTAEKDKTIATEGKRNERQTRAKRVPVKPRSSKETVQEKKAGGKQVSQEGNGKQKEKSQLPEIVKEKDETSSSNVDDAKYSQNEVKGNSYVADMQSTREVSSKPKSTSSSSSNVDDAKSSQNEMKGKSYVADMQSTREVSSKPKSTSSKVEKQVIDGENSSGKVASSSAEITRAILVQKILDVARQLSDSDVEQAGERLHKGPEVGIKSILKKKEAPTHNKTENSGAGEPPVNINDPRGISNEQASGLSEILRQISTEEIKSVVSASDKILESKGMLGNDPRQTQELNEASTSKSQSGEPTKKKLKLSDYKERRGIKDTVSVFVQTDVQEETEISTSSCDKKEQEAQTDPIQLTISPQTGQISWKLQQSLLDQLTKLHALIYESENPEVKVECVGIIKDLEEQVNKLEVDEMSKEEKKSKSPRKRVNPYEEFERQWYGSSTNDQIGQVKGLDKELQRKSPSPLPNATYTSFYPAWLDAQTVSADVVKTALLSSVSGVTSSTVNARETFASQAASLAPLTVASTSEHVTLSSVPSPGIYLQSYDKRDVGIPGLQNSSETVPSTEATDMVADSALSPISLTRNSSTEAREAKTEQAMDPAAIQANNSSGSKDATSLGSMDGNILEKLVEKMVEDRLKCLNILPHTQKGTAESMETEQNNPLGNRIEENVKDLPTISQVTDVQEVEAKSPGTPLEEDWAMDDENFSDINQQRDVRSIPLQIPPPTIPLNLTSPVEQQICFADSVVAEELNVSESCVADTTATNFDQDKHFLPPTVPPQQPDMTSPKHISTTYTTDDDTKVMDEVDKLLSEFKKASKDTTLSTSSNNVLKSPSAKPASTVINMTELCDSQNDAVQKKSPQLSSPGGDSYKNLDHSSEGDRSRRRKKHKKRNRSRGSSSSDSSREARRNVRGRARSGSVSSVSPVKGNRKRRRSFSPINKRQDQRRGRPFHKNNRNYRPGDVFNRLGPKRNRNNDFESQGTSRRGGGYSWRAKNRQWSTRREQNKERSPSPQDDLQWRMCDYDDDSPYGDTDMRQRHAGDIDDDPLVVGHSPHGGKSTRHVTSGDNWSGQQPHLAASDKRLMFKEWRNKRYINHLIVTVRKIAFHSRGYNEWRNKVHWCMIEISRREKETAEQINDRSMDLSDRGIPQKTYNYLKNSLDDMKEDMVYLGVLKSVYMYIQAKLEVDDVMSEPRDTISNEKLVELQEKLVDIQLMMLSSCQSGVKNDLLESVFKLKAECEIALKDLRESTTSST